MASYTMQLREYIEMWSYDQPNLSYKERIDLGRTKLFDFSYPIFDPAYKAVFETNFIKQFYMREIGFETEELFKLRLDNWLNINMPYYNKLFESETLTFDPLINSKMTNEHTITKNKDQTVDTTKDKTVDTTTSGRVDTDGTVTKAVNLTTNNDNTNTQTGTVANDDFNRRIHSNTPDSRLALTTNDGQGVIEYASEITENSDNTLNTINRTTTDDGIQVQTGSTTDTTDMANVSTGTGNEITDIIEKEITDILETETYIQERVGKIGVQTYSKMVMEYRQSFLRIENQIHNELQQLFMLVF